MASISASQLLVVATVARIGFFLFGLYQDEYMDVKYTDIDYLVFSDASNYVYNGLSPYLRDTYRYTPLLAWMLVPNNFNGLYSWGKFLFILSDLITGVLIMKILDFYKVANTKKLILSSIWLLNPMVITISTRGSSESLLTVIIMLSIYFLLNDKLILSAFFTGLSIHFKIYPIIYLPSFLLYIRNSNSIVNFPLLSLLTYKRLAFGLMVLISLTGFNLVMYYVYGYEFLYHSYFYHLTRIDHRHNFSLYNIALYLKSASTQRNRQDLTSSIDLQKFAFIPQILISAIILPLLFAEKDLVSCLFLQTFAFVTFNKVITSQYFIWFLIFLPIFLRNSKLINTNKTKGLSCLLIWVLGQGIWLYNAYNLEFLGINTFNPQLLLSSCFFFLGNIYVLGVFIDDLADSSKQDKIKKNV